MTDLKATYVFPFISSVITIKLLNSIFPSFISSISLIVGNSVVFILVTWFSFKFTKQNLLNQKIPIKDKAVFITGCDRGFGYLLAKRLDSKGFKVFAGCLFPSGPGAQELNLQCSNHLTTLELDVTNEESVKNAYNFVKDNLNGSVLWGVVNNAGIWNGFGVETTSLEMFKSSFDVNCFGVIRVVKAFLPLIKKSRGRIVNLTSIAGRISFPRNIAYSTSKFAVTGFNDCLRHEFDVWGIRVIAIEPDFFRTPMLRKQESSKLIDDCIKNLDPRIKEEYGEAYFEGLGQSMKTIYGISSLNLDLVINDIQSAICLRYPDSIYRPCSSWVNKLFINIYLVLSPNLRSILINFVSRNFPKPKLA